MSVFNLFVKKIGARDAHTGHKQRRPEGHYEAHIYRNGKQFVIHPVCKTKAASLAFALLHVAESSSRARIKNIHYYREMLPLEEAQKIALQYFKTCKFLTEPKLNLKKIQKLKGAKV